MLRIIILAICLMALSMGICTCNTDANAIVAVRTASVDNLGHVGVGFQNDDGTWTIGGVEGDPDKTILWGAVVPPIFGDNGGWVEEHKTLQEVAVIFHAFGYDGLKIIQVIDANPNLANFEIKSFPTRGYNVFNNNCLSATIDVLTAYGAKKLPLQIAHVAPNDYYANVKGEEYLWDSSKSTYTDLITGMPLADNPSKDDEETSSTSAKSGSLSLKEQIAASKARLANQELVQSNPESINQPSSQVTLTLYVRDGSASGPIIPGAQVIGQDGSGSSFQQTTDSNGHVTVEGNPGTWSFTAFADGYETSSWDQEIAASDTKHAFLQKLVRINKTSNEAALTLYVHDESVNGPVISNVQVNAVDEHQLNQNVTDENGMTIVTGVPGTWDFRLGAKGYYAKSWSDEISNDNTKHVFLQKLPQIKVTIYVHEGSINGPIIPGAKVNCWACTEIEQLTDGNGCAVFSMIVPESSSNHIDAYGIVIASGYKEGPWRFNDLTEAITMRIVLQKERESVTPTETSETSSKYSKNSIVGKWKIQRDMHCDGHFAKDMMSINTFNEDGTALYEDNTGSDPSYMWKQSGNTVSWSPLQTSIYQGDVGDKHQLTTYFLFHEGTIDEDTMSGTWTTHGSPNPDGEATGCWKAVRVG